MMDKREALLGDVSASPSIYRLSGEGNYGKTFLFIGIVGAIASIAGFAVDKGHFFHSYLTAFAFWLTLGLGGLFFTMLHHLTNATWSVVLRRFSENVMMILLFMALLFIPIIAGIGQLYHWSDQNIVAADAVLKSKSLYLNTGFFIVRAVFYIGVWLFLARGLYRNSLAQDNRPGEEQIRRMRKISAPGMLLFALTITFAAFDWFMSLDAHWYSTAFGVYVFSGSLLSALAFITLVTILLRDKGMLSDLITKEHYHDLGKLLFAFTVFWGYIAFAQYFLIWYANIPEETIWYRTRWIGWRPITLLIVFGHFVLPFVVLISRGAKRNLTVMKLMGFWLLFMHWVDVYWVIMPNYSKRAGQALWIDVAAMLGIGGFALWYFWRRMVSHPLVPVNDPRLAASAQLISD
jgi:hypothetical protein